MSVERRQDHHRLAVDLIEVRAGEGVADVASLDPLGLDQRVEGLGTYRSPADRRRALVGSPRSDCSPPSRNTDDTSLEH